MTATSVSTKHVLSQGPVIAALAGTAAQALRHRMGHVRGHTPKTPTDVQVMTVPPRPGRLVEAYIHHVGGDPSAYRGLVPPHMFPQWTLPLAARTLRTLPYPLHKVLNGGCCLEIRGPIEAGRPLEVRANIESIDDDGTRVIVRQRIVTGTVDRPEAVTAYLVAVIPYEPKIAKREHETVPADATEIARDRLGADAGLSFAKLTGDFNPVHWIRRYAQAVGFRSTILHGFSTVARAMEGLNRGLFAGSIRAISTFDVRLTRPLVLPTDIGLYVKENRCWVGDAPSGPAYLVGQFARTTETTA